MPDNKRMRSNCICWICDRLTCRVCGKFPKNFRPKISTTDHVWIFVCFHFVCRNNPARSPTLQIAIHPTLQTTNYTVKGCLQIKSFASLLIVEAHSPTSTQRYLIAIHAQSLTISIGARWTWLHGSKAFKWRYVHTKHTLTLHSHWIHLDSHRWK